MSCLPFQFSSILLNSTLNSAAQYSFRDPVAIPLFTIVHSVTLLLFPLMVKQ